MNNKIKVFREAAGMRQDELAGATGVTQSMISQLENGDKKPSIVVAEKIAAILNCDPTDLFDGFVLRKDTLAKLWRKLSIRQMDTLIEFAQFMADNNHKHGDVKDILKEKKCLACGNKLHKLDFCSNDKCKNSLLSNMGLTHS